MDLKVGVFLQFYSNSSEVDHIFSDPGTRLLVRRFLSLREAPPSKIDPQSRSRITGCPHQHAHLKDEGQTTSYQCNRYIRESYCVQGNKLIIIIFAPDHFDSGLTSVFRSIFVPGVKVNSVTSVSPPPRPERFGSWLSTGSRRSGKRIAEGCFLPAVHHCDPNS